MEELSNKQIDRQDYVDSKIMTIIDELTPLESDVAWDIETIGIVRDALQEAIVRRMGVMTEEEFYPSVSYDVPKEPEADILLTGEELGESVLGALLEIDPDKFSEFAGDLLGGDCWFIGNEKFAFKANEFYSGAFDHIQKIGKGK